MGTKLDEDGRVVRKESCVHEEGGGIYKGTAGIHYILSHLDAEDVLSW